MRIAVVVGNPKAKSRTLLVAEEVAVAIDSGASTLVVDLAEVAAELFDWGATSVADLAAEVAGCQVVVVASPTYKATYTGLLKAFLDRYGNNGLAGTVAVPVMVGAGPLHALAPEAYLRPLLVELGASVPSRALYVLESQVADLAPVIEAWSAVAVPQIRAATRS